MTHAITAVVALALGFGVATTAQARGLDQQSAAPAINLPAAGSEQGQQMQSSRHETDEQTVRQVQEQLKSEGLYDGEIDGIFGPQTRQALNEYQQREGLPRTATIDDNTLNQLMGSPAVGVGSSTPPTFNAPAAPAAPSPTLGAGGNGYPGGPNMQR